MKKLTIFLVFLMFLGCSSKPSKKEYPYVRQITYKGYLLQPDSLTLFLMSTDGNGLPIKITKLK